VGVNDPIREARDRLIHEGLQSALRGVHGVPELVERSWRRSVGNAVESSKPPKFREEIDLESVLRRAAVPVLEHWQNQLADTGTTLFLSDRGGQIVARRSSDPGELHRLDRVHAAEGFDYSEDSIGTNALGTSLVEAVPLFIKGSEHFSDALMVNACAAAPLFAPNGLVVGSIALGSSREAANPMMLSMVKEVGRQIESRLRSSSRPQDLALALSFMRYSSAARPTVVMDQETVLANTPGIPYVTVATHVMLWELFRSHDWSRRPHFSYEIEAAALEVTARRVTDAAHEHYIVHFTDMASSAQVLSVTPGSGTTSFNAAAGLPPARRTIGAVGLVEGPRGSGRSMRIQRLRRGMAVVLRDDFVAAAGEDLPWDKINSSLGNGRDVLIRRCEELGPDGALKFSDVLKKHQQTWAVGMRSSTLWITVSLDAAVPALRSVVGDLKPLERTFALDAAPETIPGLVKDILETVDAEARHTISPAALQAMTRWNWPGNIVELKQVVTSAVQQIHGSVIERRHLPSHIQMAAPRKKLGMIESAERDAIVKALAATGGNKSEAAEILGIGRTTLYRRIRQLHLETDEKSI
jgi:transcriptional regulator of acetoin/glycerol metabolism